MTEKPNKKPVPASLADKAIDIKGKKYVLVADRVVYFNNAYKSGCIQTKLISEPTSPEIVVRAVVVPNIDTPGRYFTGYAHELVGDGYINKTSALENAETSAVGRALAFMGIGIIDAIASADEVRNATAQAGTVVPPTDKQVSFVRSLLKEKGVAVTDVIPNFTKEDLQSRAKVKELIDALLLYKSKSAIEQESDASDEQLDQKLAA